jgi:hypothetical protein
MEEIVSPFNTWRALLAVERNGGVPGLDGMTTRDAIRPCRLKVTGRLYSTAVR